MAEAPLKLVHSVYFTLKDASDEAQNRLLAAAEKYLTGHDGCIFFAVGKLNPKLKRPVNDQDFHIALNVVFACAGDQDKYQVHPRHLQFIAENKENWERVRVFDSDAP